MNDTSNALIVEDSTVDLVLGGDSLIQNGSTANDTVILPAVPIASSESVSDSAIENNTTSVTESFDKSITDSMEVTTETFTDSIETTTETSTDVVEIPIPSISGNEIVGGDSSIVVPSMSSNNIIVTVSSNDIADLITSTVSSNNLDKGTLTEEQNLQYITLLETQNGYLSSINSTMSCLLFFTLLTWAVGIIKRITGGFAGYGHE